MDGVARYRPEHDVNCSPMVLGCCVSLRCFQPVCLCLSRHDPCPKRPCASDGGLDRASFIGDEDQGGLLAGMEAVLFGSFAEGHVGGAGSHGVLRCVGKFLEALEVSRVHVLSLELQWEW